MYSDPQFRSVNYNESRPGGTRWENHLFALSGLVAVVCLASIPYTPGPTVFEIPEVIIPLGISLGLGLYTVRLQRRNHGSDQFKPMVKYGWAGALVSGAIGAFWMALHVYYGLPIDVLPDKILTVLSAGIAAGVLVGRSVGQNRQTNPPTERTRVLAETSWASRSGPTPIFGAVVEVLAELEEADPVELHPLNEHIDPELFAELRAQDAAPWQLLFSTDKYEIRVSSHGTVTVYSADSLEETVPASSSSSDYRVI